MKNIFRVSLVVVIAIMTSFQSENLNAQVTLGTELSSSGALFDLTEPGEGRAAYDPLTGEVFVAIGSSDVLVFGIDTLNGTGENIFSVQNLDDDSGLGQYSQTDPNAIGILNIAGLPVGIFNLGPILQPDANIWTAADFATVFPDLRVRSGVRDEPAFESRMNVISVPPPLTVPESSSFIGLMTLLVTGCCARRRQS